MRRQRTDGWSGLLALPLFGLTAWGLLRFGGSAGPFLALAVALVGAGRLYGPLLRLRRLRALKLSDVDGMAGHEFEAYVALLLKRRGFAVELTGASGDLGVDLIAERADQRIAVQAKRHSRPVSRRAVSDAVAAAGHYRCNAAMVVTNSYFTEGACALAGSTGCDQVDREQLSEWIAAFRAGRTHR